MGTQIRMADEQDGEQIASIYGPFCTDTVVSFEYEAPSAQEMAGRVRNIIEDLPWLVLDQDGSLAGYAYACKHRERAAYGWSVDVGIYLRPESRRQGMGRALYTALFEVLALQGFYKAYAGVTLPNPGSTGLHEAMGFAPVGTYRGVGYKMGGWHDVVWYQRALQAEKENPPSPLSVKAILHTPAWDAALQQGLALVRQDRS